MATKQKYHGSGWVCEYMKRHGFLLTKVEGNQWRFASQWMVGFIQWNKQQPVDVAKRVIRKIGSQPELWSEYDHTFDGALCRYEFATRRMNDAPHHMAYHQEYEAAYADLKLTENVFTSFLRNCRTESAIKSWINVKNLMSVRHIMDE